MQRQIKLHRTGLIMAICVFFIGCGGSSGDGNSSPAASNDSGSPSITAPSNNNPPSSTDDNPPISIRPLDDPALPVISRTSVRPFQIFTISHPSIVRNANHRIRFVANDGFDLELSVAADVNGSLKLAAPLPMLNSDSDIELSVFLDGVATFSPITVAPLLETNAPIGSVTSAFVLASANVYKDAASTLDALPTSNPGFTSNRIVDDEKDRASERAAGLEQIADAIENGRSSVEFAPGINISLDLETLGQIDKVLYALVLGIEQDEQLAGAVVQRNVTLSHRLTRQEIDQRIASVVSSIRRGVEGQRVLLATVSVGLGSVSLAASGLGVVSLGPVGALAGASGVVIGGLTLFHEFASGITLDRIASAVNQNDRALFDQAQTTRTQLRALALSYCGATPTLPGAVCTLVSNLLGMRAFETALESAACPTQARTTEAFCGFPPVFSDPDPDPDQANPDPAPTGPAGYVLDRIEIPQSSFESGGSVVCVTTVTENSRNYDCEFVSGPETLDFEIDHSFQLRANNGDVFVPGEMAFIDVQATISGYSFCCSVGNNIAARFAPIGSAFVVDSVSGVGTDTALGNGDLPATGNATLFTTERMGTAMVDVTLAATIPDAGGDPLQIVLTGQNGSSVVIYHLRMTQ